MGYPHPLVINEVIGVAQATPSTPNLLPAKIATPRFKTLCSRRKKTCGRR
jgi:hypothetical protein